MGLRDQALAATATAAANQLTGDAKYDQETTDQFVAALSDYWTGVTVTPMTPIRGDHPEMYPGRYGTEYLRRMPHRIVRAEVDGVVFCDGIVYDDAHVQVPCTNCAQPAFVSLREKPWKYKSDTTTYAYVRQPDHREEFLVKLGAVLSKPALCWNCKIGVPATCPTCARSNP